jgi:hypothetical protein
MEKTDRIERGIELARAGKVHRSGDAFKVESASSASLVYTVKADGSCDCPDATERQTICKHAFASVGRELAELLLDFRTATTLEELDSKWDSTASVAATLARGFKLTMRHEYALQFGRIAQEREAEKQMARQQARATPAA